MGERWASLWGGRGGGREEVTGVIHSTRRDRVTRQSHELRDTVTLRRPHLSSRLHRRCAVTRLFSLVELEADRFVRSARDSLFLKDEANTCTPCARPPSLPGRPFSPTCSPTNSIGHPAAFSYRGFAEAQGSCRRRLPLKHSDRGLGGQNSTEGPSPGCEEVASVDAQGALNGGTSNPSSVNHPMFINLKRQVMWPAYPLLCDLGHGQASYTVHAKCYSLQSMW